jgi:rod shape-determining protein MreD
LPGVLPGAGQFIPDLVLLLAVAWSLMLEWNWSLTLAFFAGLALDFLGSSLYPLGFNALLFIIIVLPLTLINRENLRLGVLRSVPIALGAALGYRILLLLGGRILGYNNLQLQNITQVVLPVAIIDAALMLALFVIIRWLSKIGASRE